MLRSIGQRCAAIALLWLLSGPVAAHLLNMTEALFEVAADGSARLVLDLDLTREFGSDADYYEFSRTPAEALSQGELAARWERLAAAIELHQPGPAGTTRVPLQWLEVEPPAGFSLADFQSPFVWPRTRVVLAAQVDRRRPVTLRFSNRFRFEEPIATRMVDGASELKRSRWLVANQRGPLLPLAAGVEPAQDSTPSPEEAWSYVRAGFVHILPRGLDHLLFVLLLFLASRSLRDLVGQISVFTIAHSITLVMASYRVIEPAAGVVEPLIALSIVWVALENLWSRRVGATRYAVIFGFGLLHGMGFAGALAELELPRSHFLVLLLAFNGGVELGQLSFLLLLALLLGWFRDSRHFRRRAVVPLSAASGLLAMFWLISRL